MSIQNGRVDGGHKKTSAPRFTKSQMRQDVLNGVRPAVNEWNPSVSNPTELVQRMPEQDLIRSIRPCGLIVLGGSGGQVLRRTKRLLELQRTHKFVTYRLFDTDPTAQTNSDLTDKQFCLIRTGGTFNALENPEGHELLVNRFDLNDPIVRTTAEALHKTDQAGQVRFQGCHALLSDLDSVRASLLEMLQEMNGTHVRLEKQMEAKNSIRIRERMKFYIVSSLGGGTGSSAQLEICGLLRDIAQGVELDIVPICIAPSAFERVLLHRPDQWMRVLAGSYASMQEINAFMEGFGTRYAIDLGSDERHHYTLDSGFANEIFIVGRHTADGRDLGSDQAVFDLVATYLAADIGTEISDQLEMDDANQCTLKGLSVDPATGLSRYLATIGANALCLDTNRTASYCSLTTLTELLDQVVVGKATDAASLNLVVKGWIDNPTESTSGTLTISGISETLNRASLPNIKGKLASAFVGQRGRVWLHARDTNFAARFNSVRASLASQSMQKYREQLSKGESTLTKTLVESLINCVHSRVVSYGIADGLEFLKGVRSRLQAMESSTKRTADEELRKANEMVSQIDERLAPFSMKWLRRFTKSKARQIQLVTDLELSFNLQLTGETNQASARILGQLNATVVALHDRLHTALRCSETLLKKLLERREEYRAGRRVTTTNSLAEIDIASPHTDHQLYQRFCPSLAKQGPSMKTERLEWYLDLCNEGESLQQLESDLHTFFETKMETIDIVEILADQLMERQTAPEVNAKLRQTMLSSQPAWTANAHNNSVQFADVLIVGIPESTNPSKRQIVVDAMMQSASSRINANNQYRGSVKHVVAGDRHKIYVIRQTHGATWHYLPEVRSCFEAYEQWMKSGGHPVHIFNKKTVAKMNPLLPLAKLAPERVATAIGMAYGWIAKRGPRLYANLHRNESGVLYCSLSSHIPTVADVGKGGRISSLNRPIEALCASGQLVYEHGDTLDDANRLGETWSEVVSVMADKPNQVQLCLDAFDSLRAVAGDEAVAEELEQYLDLLSAPELATQNVKGLMECVSEILHRKIKELR